MRSGTGCSDLLHDTGLALRESNVSTRLVLNELDVNLPALTARLFIIIVIIVAGSSADARTFDTAIVSALASVAIAAGQDIIVSRG